MSCKKGMIMRKGYLRKGYFRSDGTYVEPSYVPSSCIVDLGFPGKGTPIVTDLKDLLSPFGYKLSLSESSRKKTLLTAMNNVDKLKVLKHLVYLRTLNKNRKNLYDILDEDVKFIQSEYKKSPKRKSPKRKSPKRK